MPSLASQAKPAGPFGVADVADILGGHRRVATAADRNAIPAYLRKNGMVVTVNADGTTANNTDWVYAGADETADNGQWVDKLAAAPVSIAQMIGLAGRVPAENVLTYGADETGDLDSYSAFIAMVDAAPAGGSVQVPRGSYYLSANPYPGGSEGLNTKSLTWYFAPGTEFTGPGALSDANPNGFPSNIGNGWQRPIGMYTRCIPTDTHPASGGTSVLGGDLIIPAALGGQHVLNFWGLDNASTIGGHGWVINATINIRPGATGTSLFAEVDCQNASDSASLIGLAFTVNGGAGLYKGQTAFSFAGNNGGQWENALQGGNCDVFLRLHTEYVSNGIYDTQAGLPNGSWLQLRQLVDGHAVAYFVRKTDVNPTGYFVNFVNAALDTSLFSVDIAGGLVGASGTFIGNSAAGYSAVISRNANTDVNKTRFVQHVFQLEDLNATVKDAAYIRATTPIDDVAQSDAFEIWVRTLDVMGKVGAFNGDGLTIAGLLTASGAITGAAASFTSAVITGLTTSNTFASAESKNAGSVGLTLRNKSVANNTNKYIGGEYYGTTQAGTDTRVGILRFYPLDADWASSRFELFSRIAGTVTRVISATKYIGLEVPFTQCPRVLADLSTNTLAADYPGCWIEVTDATGGPKLCRSDGSYWKVSGGATTVS